MAVITAEMVRNLREKTDLPMMECKQALTECAGNADNALDWLRKKHKGKLADRAGKATGEGRIGVYIDEARKVGSLAELQCETAPVAKNELFIGLANAFAKKAAMGPAASPDLGTAKHAEYVGTAGRLEEGHTLALFTRGCTTACNDDGEPLGEKRFLNALCKSAGESAAVALEDLLADTADFFRAGCTPDDVTVLLAHRPAS